MTSIAPNDNFANRRQAARQLVTLPTSYRLHSGLEGTGRTLDMSATGVRLETDRELPVGYPVLLRLQSCALPAYVRWARGQGDRFEVGLALSPGCPSPLSLL